MRRSSPRLIDQGARSGCDACGVRSIYSLRVIRRRSLWGVRRPRGTLPPRRARWRASAGGCKVYKVSV